MIQRLRIRDLIKSKGGAVHVAELCGVAQPTVSRWGAQGSIPPKYALMLEQLWGIDADLLHNPWGIDVPSWVSKAEQLAILKGDYELRLDAPRKARAYVEPLIDPNEPVEFEPFEDGEEEEEWAEPVERKQGWTEDEIAEMFGSEDE